MVWRPEGANPFIINRQRTDQDRVVSKKYVVDMEKDLIGFKKYLEDNELMTPYKQSKEKALADSFKIVELAKQADNIIDEFNTIVGKLNNAAGADDIDAFRAAKLSLVSLVYKHRDVGKWVKSKMGVIPFVSPMRTLLAQAFTYMMDARDHSEKYLKRMGMTPAKRSAAEKASARMRMAWME